MIIKTIAILALSVATSGAAWAQTNDQTEESGTTGRVGVSGRGSDTGSLPPDWDGEIGDALFLDTGAGTLRSERDFRENWAKLSAEQQQAVRTHCREGQTPPDQKTEPAEPEVTQGSLIRLCSWVDEM